MFYMTKPLSGAMNDYVNINFVAKTLGISIDTARRRIKARTIPQPFKTGRGGFFWDRKEMEAFAAKAEKGEHNDIDTKPHACKLTASQKSREDKRVNLMTGHKAFEEPKASERILWAPGDERPNA